jgi:tripartite-type tricarboxylate transporter receptor subunit TctC
VVTPLMQKIPYDGVEDFSFIAVVANQPNVLVVNPSLGISSLDDLVKRAKAEPAKFNFASAGAGGATHLGAEAVWQRAGLRMAHVPYAGAAPALKDLVGGQVQAGMLNLSATLPLIEGGRLKALAFGSKQRSALLPQVPTLAELGFAGTEVSTWYTIAAPKGTPMAIIDALSKHLASMNADPVYQKLPESQGAERLDLTPAETTAFVRQDKEAMSKLLTALDLLGK